MTDNPKTADILASKEMNERFTCLDAAGKPLNRVLRKMTPDQVQAAIDWQLSEADSAEDEILERYKLEELIESGKVISPEPDWRGWLAAERYWFEKIQEACRRHASKLRRFKDAMA